MMFRYWRFLELISILQLNFSTPSRWRHSMMLFLIIIRYNIELLSLSWFIISRLITCINLFNAFLWGYCIINEIYIVLVCWLLNARLYAFLVPHVAFGACTVCRLLSGQPLWATNLISRLDTRAVLLLSCFETVSDLLFLIWCNVLLCVKSVTNGGTT